jgi:hypothetical protein
MWAAEDWNLPIAMARDHATASNRKSARGIETGAKVIL